MGVGLGRDMGCCGEGGRGRGGDMIALCACAGAYLGGERNASCGRAKIEDGLEATGTRETGETHGFC